MAYVINNPSFISPIVDWTIGANVAWAEANLAPDNHGVNGVFVSPDSGTGTDNRIWQTGVFPDFGTSTQHRVTIVVNNYAGGSGVAVRFGTTTVGTITAAGTFTYTGAATGNDIFSMEVLLGTLIEIDHVAVADVIMVDSHQTFQPAYNPNIWYFDSVNKTQPGFRYLVEVLNSSNVVIATYRYAPAITTGYAIVDLTKILQNFVSFDDTTSGVQTVPNSWYGYYLKVYEEFSVPFVYQDYDNPSADLTALVATSNTHTFIVGDQITVAQTDGGALKPMLQGLHTVIYPTVSGTTDVYIDVPFSTVGTGAAIGGSIIYADNRKTISVVQYTSGLYYIFNGAVPFVDFLTWDENDYLMDGASSTTKFLSSIPRSFRVTETQDIRLNFANWFSNTTKVIYFENDGGDKFSVTTATSMTSQAVISASVGASTTMGTTLVGTLPLIKDDTIYYDVWVTNAATQYSEKIRFYVDRRCKIEDYEIKFLDRMGSEGSFAFQLRSEESESNDKSTYKKLEFGDGGEQSYNIELKEGLKLTTNWMDDASSVYFKELVSSPYTLLKDGANYVPVIVSNSSHKVERQKNKRLIKYTIDVRYSYNSSINI